MVGKVLYETREFDLNRRRLHLKAICMPSVLSPTILAKRGLSHLVNRLNVPKKTKLSVWVVRFRAANEILRG